LITTRREVKIMNKLFKKKSEVEPKVEIAEAPNEPETVGESKHIGELDAPSGDTPVQSPAPDQPVREVPVCLSQAQVNTLVIDNNIMLKELLSIALQE
jgi:hypothetical protein